MSAASELDLYLANEEGQNLFNLASKKLETYPLLSEKTVAESFAYDPDEEIRNFIDTLRHSQQLRKTEFERVKRLIVDEADLFHANVDDVNTTPFDGFGDDFADGNIGEDGDEVLLGDEESTAGTGKGSSRTRMRESLGASIDSLEDIERSATRIATGRDEGGPEDALATVTRMRRLIHSAMVSEEDYELNRKSAPSKQDLLRRIDQSMDLFKPLITAEWTADGPLVGQCDEDSSSPYHSEEGRSRGCVRSVGRSSRGHARGRGRRRAPDVYDGDQASSPSPDGPRSAMTMKHAHESESPLKGSSEEFFLNQAVAERMRDIDRNSSAYRGHEGEGKKKHRHHHHNRRRHHHDDDRHVDVDNRHGEEHGDENREPATTGANNGGLVNVEYLLGHSEHRARNTNVDADTEYEGWESGDSESDTDMGMQSPSPGKVRHGFDPTAAADSPETPFSNLAAAAAAVPRDVRAGAVDAVDRMAHIGSRVHFEDAPLPHQAAHQQSSHGGRILFAPESGGAPMSILAKRTAGEVDMSSVHHMSTENSFGFTPTQDHSSHPSSALRKSDPELKWI